MKMMLDRREQVLSAIDDLDNHGFFDDPCTIIFFFGTNDNGERYVDCEMVKGHIIYGNREKHKDLAEYIGAEDLHEAIIQLNEAHGV